MKKKKQQKPQDPAIAIAEVLDRAGVPVSEATGIALVELGAYVATLADTPVEVLLVELVAGVDSGKKEIADMAAQGIVRVGGLSAARRK